MWKYLSTVGEGKNYISKYLSTGGKGANKEITAAVKIFVRRRGRSLSKGERRSFVGFFKRENHGLAGEVLLNSKGVDQTSSFRQLNILCD